MDRSSGEGESDCPELYAAVRYNDYLFAKHFGWYLEASDDVRAAILKEAANEVNEIMLSYCLI